MNYVDFSKFKGIVQDCWIWKDHNSPSLDLLFEMCDLIHGYLKGDKINVIVVNCLASKGRTGTIICCQLLYTGRSKNVQDVLYYYEKKRFGKEGLGVNQVCRIFLQTFNFGAPAFRMRGGCKSFLQVIQVKKDQELYPKQKQ